MEDIIVYLIFLAFALLSRFLTKKKNQQKNEPGKQNRPTASGDKRPQSFEELLKEFTEGKQESTSRQEEYEEANTDYDSYEPVPEREKYDAPTKSYDQDDEEIQEVYEKSVNQAKGLKTIDELVDYDTIKTKLDKDKFDPYAQETTKTLADEIRDDLQKRDEVRKAVIYSEIIKRKY